MSQEKHEQELQDYLQGDSELSKTYQLASKELPPAHLDDVILAASRKAVKSKPYLAFSPFASNWHVPVALAAVLTLCVTLVISLQDETGKAYLRSDPDASLQSTKGIDDDTDVKLAIVATRKVQGSQKQIADESAQLEAPEAPAEKNRQIVMQFNSRMQQAVSKVEMATGLEREKAEDRQLPSRKKLLQALPIVRQREKAIGLFAEDTMSSRVITPQALAQSEAGFAGSVIPDVAGGPDNATGFLKKLLGKWRGRAVHTPVGPTPYDIEFTWQSKNCISGTANNSFSHHNWTFCEEKSDVTLDFLSDFRGNDQTIHLNPLSMDDGVMTFMADTHQFMQVLVAIDKDKAWMKIMHYGKLHVEIKLQRVGHASQ
ncbi:MAG: hypothetical protein O6928_02935 [Gammaproteobacteria bacterium]|nr:hypothetical protein [Gammaproteobacteria bacterium]